jgi:hypothetical protein
MSVAGDQSAKSLCRSQFHDGRRRTESDLQIARDGHLRFPEFRHVRHAGCGDLYCRRSGQVGWRRVNARRGDRADLWSATRDAVHAPHDGRVTCVCHRRRKGLCPQNHRRARRHDRHGYRSRRARRRRRFRNRRHESCAEAGAALQSTRHQNEQYQCLKPRTLRVFPREVLRSSFGKGRMPVAMQANNQRKRTEPKVAS